ncbi:hypothetical protein [Nonomuraea recticatena]
MRSIAVPRAGELRDDHSLATTAGFRRHSEDNTWKGVNAIVVPMPFVPCP